VPSLSRGRVCRLQFLLAFASAVIFGSESRRTLGHILLPQIETSLFVASYDSQGHGGGIRPRFHTVVGWDIFGFSLHSLGSDHSTEDVAQQWIYAKHIENTSCDTGSIVAYAYFGRCLEMGPHVTLLLV
jgi:hypothetical protein